MKKILLLFTIVSIFHAHSTSAVAVECFTDFAGDRTIDSQVVGTGESCTLRTFVDGNDSNRLVSGLDASTGQINTAKLTVSSGTVTINSNETLVIGSLELSGGSIALATGGRLSIGTPLWMIDEDNDGIPSSTTIYYQTSAPTNGVRISTISNLAAIDCNDASYSTSNNCSYHRPITLSYSGTTLTNHDVVFSLDTASLIAAGKMTADCGDIRLLDSDASTSLIYWIEGGCNTSNTQIWTRVPSIPDGGKTIYVTYDGTTATNGQEAWSGSFIMLNNTACPSGWTRNTSFDNRFPYGAASYGTTGGADTHVHTNASCTTGTPSAIDGNNSYGGGNLAHANHAHTGAQVAIDSTSNMIPYLNMVYCNNSDLTISSGLIGLFTSTPTGWTRFSALDSRFPRGASSYGTTGGASSHQHNTTGGYTTGLSGTSNESPDGSQGNGNHTHTTTNGTTGSGTHTPPYLNMIYASINSAGRGVSNMIVMSTATPPLGWTRYTSLDSRFPQGAATQGSTGGTSTHTHSVTITTNISGTTGVGAGYRVNSISHRNHTHSCSATTASASHIPAYLTTLFIQRNSPSPTLLVGTESSGELNCQEYNYYQDQDGDGFGAGSPTYMCAASGYVLNNTDCNDTGTNAANVSIALSCYIDQDNDNYGINSTVSCVNTSSCATATWGSGGAGTTASAGTFSTVNTDCYDSNANAYPTSSYCGTTHRGDGSYDYNCNSSQTECGTDYNYSASGTNQTYAGISGSCGNCNRSCGSSSNTIYSAASIGCGQAGAVCTSFNGFIGGGCTRNIGEVCSPPNNACEDYHMTSEPTGGYCNGISAGTQGCN